MLESAIQTSIKNKLEASGYFVLKIMLSNKAGIMDLLVLKDGNYIWIEVKQPGKKPTPLQEYQKRELIKHGAKVIYVDSVKDIQALCSNRKQSSAKL